MKAQFSAEQSESGQFIRQEDAFRSIVGDDPRFSPEAGRYHLYVSLACPWAHRTLIVRRLLGLEESVGVTIADPVRDDRGWAFRNGDGHDRDEVNGFRYLREAYTASDPDFDGRVTVPVLWDKRYGCIVNNSEDDICRMFQDAFASSRKIDLFPEDIAGEQAVLSGTIYETVNNGVYQAGFATAQQVYEVAVTRLFRVLDRLDQRLAEGRYLFGSRIVETDWRLFCTLVRFDSVYHGHFKCNLRRIADYPNLFPYLRDLYQQPGIATTVNFDHIKRHYYITHGQINPTGIVPLGPIMDLDEPHGRGT
jgi:putative glutathione S-transferase